MADIKSVKTLPHGCDKANTKKHKTFLFKITQNVKRVNRGKG